MQSDYLEVYTVAHAWVLFERLIYKNVVKKKYRRIYLAACLSVSKKLEDFDNYQRFRKDLELLINPRYREQSGNDRDIMNMHKWEFRVLEALNFQCKVPSLIVQKQLNAILRMCDTNLEAFIEEEAFQFYTQQLPKKSVSPQKILRKEKKED